MTRTIGVTFGGLISRKCQVTADAANRLRTCGIFAVLALKFAWQSLLSQI
jgi:hypothetical protein